MRSAALSLALLVVLAGFAPPVTSGAGESAATSGLTAIDENGTRPSLTAPSDVTIDVRLLSNASARWSISLTYLLETRNETAAFRAYGEDFESGDARTAIDAATFRRLAAQASNQTGRPMDIRDVERTATVEGGGERGRLTLAFTWTSFLEREDVNTLRFNDAVLVGENRTWISSLESGQTMVIRTPPGYNINSTQIPPFDLRNNAVVIEGPREFDGELTVVYRRDDLITPDAGPPWEMLGLLAVVGLLLAGGYVVLRRRRTEGAGETTAAEAGTTPEEPRDGSEPGVEHSEGEPDEEEVDLSLLSDEERVEHLLERNGGRMKQANIVRETDWSDAKVSQLLSSMAEEGRVEKLRLGRENLISLPDRGDGE